jgi:protein-S-isoprenylcysteine O-methyltransferase Ste14
MGETVRGIVFTLLAVAAYGALHSVLASLWAKRLARGSLGEAGARAYRLAYNVVAVLTLLPVLAVPAVSPGSELYRVRPPWVALTLAGQGLALAALAFGLLQTDPWHFLGVRQLVENEGERPSRLVVSGLYRWVRHPLYTAGLVFIWLTPWMTTSVLALNLALTAYILIGSGFEERRLTVEFGPAYTDYVRRVPRLLPRPPRSS